MFDTALVRATLTDRATASSTEKVLVSGDVARDGKDEEEGLTEIDTTSFEVTYGQPSNSRQKAVVFPATQASSDEPTPATKRRHSPASGAMEGPSFSDDSKGKLKRNEGHETRERARVTGMEPHEARQPRAIPSGLALPTTKAARLSNPLARRILP